MNILKKNLLLILPALLISIAGFSQNAPGKVSYLPVELSNDTDMTYLSFTAEVYNGICYFKWTVKDQKLNGVYCIEGSENGTDFEIIGLKEGIGTTLKQPLLYCFQEMSQLAGNVYYRIRHISEMNTLSISTVINPVKKEITNSYSQKQTDQL